MQYQTPSRKYTYQYDLMGNILQKAVQGGVTTTYAYNIANELTQRNGAAVFRYDYNGNMIGSSSWNMAYNAQNQLVEVNDGTNTISSYEYNGEGLRTRKVTPSKIERYYYIGGRLAYITNDANALKYYFTRDTRGKLLHMIDYTGVTPKTYCYIHDAHDNVIGLADSSGYRVVNYEYDAWGNILNATGTITLGNGLLLVNENPFRYCGYQFDNETGWYYLKTRYYAPSIARFLTRDPLLNLNRYSYAANNPVTNFDPNGFRTMAMDGGGGRKRPKIYYHAGAAISDYIRNQPGHVESLSLQAFIGITDISWESFGMYALKTSSASNLMKSALSKALKTGVFSSTILGISTKTNIESYGYDLGLKMSLIDVAAFGASILLTGFLAPVIVAGAAALVPAVLTSGMVTGVISFGTGVIASTAIDYYAFTIKENLLWDAVKYDY